MRDKVCSNMRGERILLTTKPILQKPIQDHWIDIREEDIRVVEKYLRKEPISVIDGGILSEFEETFANFVGTKHAVAYCNGTAALHAATFAVGANSNCNFIMSEYSYHGTVNATLENKAEVLMCDYDPHTLNIDGHSAEQLINEKTKGFVITHCWGNPVDMDCIQTMKHKYNLSVISDASHAHGAQWRGMNIGALACEDVACFSLGKNKLISVGELGVAVTNDDSLYDQLLFMGHPNRVPNALITESLKGYSNGIGNKYRPHPLSMVLAIQQLRRYDEKKQLNISTNKLLSDKISRIPGYRAIYSYEAAERVYWKLQFRIDHSYWGNIPNETVIAALVNEGLPLQQFHNYNIHEHEQIWQHQRYKGMVKNYSLRDTPSDVIVLPGFVQLDENTIKLIVQAFEKVSEMRGKWI